jgi:hypothetical protein
LFHGMKLPKSPPPRVHFAVRDFRRVHGTPTTPGPEAAPKSHILMIYFNSIIMDHPIPPGRGPERPAEAQALGPGSSQVTAAIAPSPAQVDTCIRCGSWMRRREGKRFWGCIAFPYCGGMRWTPKQGDVVELQLIGEVIRIFSNAPNFLTQLLMCGPNVEQVTASSS